MPGSRAQIREAPDFALKVLESEGHENIDLIRMIVRETCQLGPCRVGDPNKTRALAIQALDQDGTVMPQFFAIITPFHKGLHSRVGPNGFSIQVAFRGKIGDISPGLGWFSDRFDYHKANQTWWRNDFTNIEEIEQIMAVIARGRRSFLNNAA